MMISTLWYLWKAGGGLDWSDWGSDEAYQSVEGAADQAEQWIRTVAENKEWNSGELAYGLSYVNEAEDSAETATQFWARLYTIWDSEDESDLDGWSQLSKVWASAADTSATEADSREEGSISSVVGGTLSETASDLDEQYNTPKVWLTVAAIAAAALFITVKAAR